MWVLKEEIKIIKIDHNFRTYPDLLASERIETNYLYYSEPQ